MTTTTRPLPSGWGNWAFNRGGGGGGAIEPPKTGGGSGKRAQLTGPLISHYEVCRRRRQKFFEHSKFSIFSPNIWQMMTFLNPLDALLPKIPVSFFADFWVRVTSEAWGSVSVGFWGSCQLSPFWGRVGSSLYRPTAPSIESPVAPGGYYTPGGGGSAVCPGRPLCICSFAFRCSLRWFTAEDLPSSFFFRGETTCFCHTTFGAPTAGSPRPHAKRQTPGADVPLNRPKGTKNRVPEPPLEPLTSFHRPVYLRDIRTNTSTLPRPALRGTPIARATSPHPHRPNRPRPRATSRALPPR